MSLSPYGSRLNWWGVDPEIRLATYAKLLNVFEARKMKLKAGICDFAPWSIAFMWGFVGAGTTLAAFLFIRLALAAAGVTKPPVGHKAAIALASASLFGISIATRHWLSKHSVVEFRYSHEGHSLYDLLRSSNPVAVAIVAAIAGALVTVVVERLFKWLWP